MMSAFTVDTMVRLTMVKAQCIKCGETKNVLIYGWGPYGLGWVVCGQCEKECQLEFDRINSEIQYSRIKELHKNQTKVAIVRSNGTIESDWQLNYLPVLHMGASIYIRVYHPNQQLEKVIPIDQFKQLNQHHLLF